MIIIYFAMKKKNRHEGNFNPDYVWYKGKIYSTGNRYHTLIELYHGKEFYRTVQMSKVEPV